MAQDRSQTVSAPEAISSTSESQSAYNDLRRLIPSLASELELLRTALREHSLWLLRYGHGNSQPAASTAHGAGEVPQPSGSPGTTAGQPPSADHSQPPAVTHEVYIEPRVVPPSQPSIPAASLPPPPSTTAQTPSASSDSLPDYTTSDVPAYTGGFSTVSASTREEVSQRRDQLAEWLREGEDVLREYSARFAQLAEELGLPQEDLLGTWRDANPDNALPDYQMIEEREELMVGGVGEVPPPYLRG
ncbi:hypothetical protein VPNG_09302 [Cytospora leucostoma]|uniref:Uncharacterized protein n=1 Tax=Cytospora leucostoma TaxID=1230097 RepID=A0A423VUU0_9PEZI|nr:hypothetical protein VPNG_09302 [Cytospora leucostoma]